MLQYIEYIEYSQNILGFPVTRDHLERFVRESTFLFLLELDMVLKGGGSVRPLTSMIQARALDT